MSIDDLVEESGTRCLHQLFRPPPRPEFLKSLGKGECSVCSYDPVNNPRCTGFVPVSFVTRRIVNEEGEYRG